ALQRLGGALRARVFALLDDGSPEVRALALRVAAKLGGDRTGEPLALTPARIVAAAATTPILLPEAAAFALATVAARHPEMRAAAARALARRQAAATTSGTGALPASLAPLLARLSHDPSDLVRGALAHLEP